LSHDYQLKNAADNETMIRAYENGAVSLYYDNSAHLSTTAAGGNLDGVWSVNNGLKFYDTIKAQFGTGDDLQIYHDGTNSRITNTSTNDFYLDTGSDFYIRNTNTEKYLKAVANGGVLLYYNNGSRIETTSDGVLCPSSYVNADNSGHNYTGLATNAAHGFRQTANNWIMKVVNSHSSAPYGLHIDYNNSTISDGGHHFVYCNNSSQLKAEIMSNGSFGSRTNSYSGISDIKLKENIVDAGSQWDDIKALKVRNFNFKTDDPSEKQLGVIAQELETVSPGLVFETKDKDPKTLEDLETTTKKVKYSILYMKAVKALQEAITKIETLETKVAALEAK